MSRLIEFKNVSKFYGENLAVDSFNLNINKGDFLSIVGTSGSGKTTIMKMINGLVIPDRGKVLIKGKDIQTMDLISLRRKIGYAIQGNGLFPHLSVYDNIGYVPRLEGKKDGEINEIVKDMINLVGLPEEIVNRFPNELSGGQAQRVGIARAYANSPHILLMDEPFGAVDSITRYQLQSDLKNIHNKTRCTIVFITHDIYEAFKLSTHILVLDKGKIQQFGRTEEVWNNPQNEFVKKLIDMTK